MLNKNFKKVRPAIYISNFCDWGWVSLVEIAEILGLKPSEVVEKYAYLSKDYQDNVLAYSVGDRIINEDVDRLIETIQYLEGINRTEIVFCPAQWANDTIDLATGVTARRKKERAEKEAQRIVAEFKREGYSSFSFGEDTNFSLAVHAAVVLLLGDKTCNIIRAQGEECHRFDDFWTEWTWVFYNPTRFVESFANYGPHQLEEDSKLKKDGFFCVASDCISSSGSAYYLKDLNK